MTGGRVPLRGRGRPGGQCCAQPATMAGAGVRRCCEREDSCACCRAGCHSSRREGAEGEARGAARRPSLALPLFVVALSALARPGAAQVSIPQYTNISRIAKMLGTSWAGAGYDSSGEAHYLYRPDGDFTGARRAPGTLAQRSHACGRRSGSRPRIIAMRAVCVAPSVAGRHSYQPPPPPPLLRARCAACACRVRVPTGRGLFALTCAHPRPSSSSGCVVGQSKIVHPGQGGRPSAWWSSCCWT